MRLKLFLCIALALTLGVGAIARAQENHAIPSATSELPFTNDGANEPVLHTLSPDGVPIEEHKKAGLPQFDPTTFSKQLFWLAVTFAFLFFVYSRNTLPKIGAVLANRQARISGDLQKAEELKNQVEKVRGEYEAAIASAQSEAQQRITDVQNEIKRLSEEQDAAFKVRGDESTDALESKLDNARARVIADLNSIAADLTVDITGRVTGTKPDASAARNVIEGMTSKARAA